VSASGKRLESPAFREAYERGVAQWPEVRLEASLFFKRLERSMHGIGEAPEEIQGLRVEDLYLVTALETGDNRAWEVFHREFKPHVLQALARLVQNSREREEVAHEVLTGLYLPREGAGGIPLNTYSGKGGLKGWVQITAIRRVYRSTRDRSRAGRVQALEAPPVSPRPDPQARVGNQEILDALQTALPGALGDLTEGERTLLRLRFQRGFQLRELGTWYGQDKSTLSKRLKALSEKLRQAILKRLESMRRFDCSDIEGVWESLGRERPEGLDTWFRGENPE